MDVEAVVEQLRRWWRIVAIVALLALAWLLAAPRGPAPTSVALSGPKLSRTAGASSAGAPDGAGSAAASPVRPRVRHVVVHVAGAVRRPGVYRVRAPGRLIDAVRRAGGLTHAADLTQINLAAHLTDGRAIIVPQRPGEVGAAGASGGAAAGSAPPGSAPGGPVGKLNVNTASAEQLDGLDGVGPAMAAAIVQLRTKLGGFTRLDQLDDVPGVGEKRLASLEQQLEL